MQIVKKFFFKELRLKLKKKINASKKVLILDFFQKKNISKKFCFFFIIEEKTNKKYIFRSFFPLVGEKKEIILIFKFKKVKKISNFLKNPSFTPFLKISKIIKMLNIKKNMKKLIGIIISGSNSTAVWTFLEFFSKINMRTQIRILWKNDCKEKIPFLKELENFELNFPNIKIFYSIKKPFTTFYIEEKIIIKNQIQKFIGRPNIGKTILVCGPLKINLEIFKILHSLGFSKESIIKF